MEQTVLVLATQLGEFLSTQQKTIATAESCTGGWISTAITEIPGSSAWFDRGFVTYSNSAKLDMLGVSAETLSAFGAVSHEMAEAMVTGALKYSTADVAVAITGIAGPDGGTIEKPVGLVFIACQWRGQTPVVIKKLFIGNRHQIRQQSVETALALPSAHTSSLSE